MESAIGTSSNDKRQKCMARGDATGVHVSYECNNVQVNVVYLSPVGYTPSCIDPLQIDHECRVLIGENVL